MSYEFISIYGADVCIEYGNDGVWQDDYLYIYAPGSTVSDENVSRIIEYVYSEGFIQDRRIEWILL